jgi:hypothetical protein
VCAPDRQAAQAFLGPQIIAAHLADELPGWSVRGAEVLTHTEGPVLYAYGIPKRFTDVLRIVELLEADRPDLRVEMC